MFDVYEHTMSFDDHIWPVDLSSDINKTREFYISEDGVTKTVRIHIQVINED